MAKTKYQTIDKTKTQTVQNYKQKSDNNRTRAKTIECQRTTLEN